MAVKNLQCRIALLISSLSTVTSSGSKKTTTSAVSEYKSWFLGIVRRSDGLWRLSDLYCNNWTSCIESLEYKGPLAEKVTLWRKCRNPRDSLRELCVRLKQRDLNFRIDNYPIRLIICALSSPGSSIEKWTSRELSLRHNISFVLIKHRRWTKNSSNWVRPELSQSYLSKI